MDNFGNNRILIVDDNKDIHNAFKMILSPEQSDNASINNLVRDLFDDDKTNGKGFKIATGSLYDMTFALGGEESIELVRKSVEANKPFAMCYMDMRMSPGIDGLHALKAIWELDPRIEAVICSAHTDYSWEQIIEELGDSDRFLYLKKPFEVVEVQQMTLSLVKKWNRLIELESR